MFSNNISKSVESFIQRRELTFDLNFLQCSKRTKQKSTKISGMCMDIKIMKNWKYSKINSISWVGNVHLYWDLRLCTCSTIGIINKDGKKINLGCNTKKNQMTTF